MVLGEESSDFALSWKRDQISNERTSGVKLVLNIWQFITVMLFTLIEIAFDIQGIFTTFQEGKSTVENIWIKDFCDCTIN